MYIELVQYKSHSVIVLGTLIDIRNLEGAESPAVLKTKVQKSIMNGLGSLKALSALFPARDFWEPC